MKSSSSPPPPLYELAWRCADASPELGERSEFKKWVSAKTCKPAPTTGGSAAAPASDHLLALFSVCRADSGNLWHVLLLLLLPPMLRGDVTGELDTRPKLCAPYQVPRVVDIDGAAVDTSLTLADLSSHTSGLHFAMLSTSLFESTAIEELDGVDVIAQGVQAESPCCANGGGGRRRHACWGAVFAGDEARAGGSRSKDAGATETPGVSQAGASFGQACVGVSGAAVDGTACGSGGNDESDTRRPDVCAGDSGAAVDQSTRGSGSKDEIDTGRRLGVVAAGVNGAVDDTARGSGSKDESDTGRADACAGDNGGGEVGTACGSGSKDESDTGRADVSLAWASAALPSCTDTAASAAKASHITKPSRRAEAPGAPAATSIRRVHTSSTSCFSSSSCRCNARGSCGVCRCIGGILFLATTRANLHALRCANSCRIRV